MPRYSHAARRDAFCTKRQHKEVMRFCSLFHPDRDLSGGGGSSAGFPQHAHGCVLTQRVYFSLTQRRRFGRNIKDSGDSGSTFSASTFFALSWMMLVAGTEGTRSLSRVTDCTTGFGNLSYGLHFPVRHPPVITNQPPAQFRHCHNVTVIKTGSRRTTDNTQRAQLSVAIDSSRSVN